VFRRRIAYIIRQLEDPTNWCRQAIVRIERKESFLPFSLANFHPLASSPRDKSFVETKDRPGRKSRAYTYTILLIKKKEKENEDVHTERKSEREVKKEGNKHKAKVIAQNGRTKRTRPWLGVIIGIISSMADHYFVFFLFLPFNLCAGGLLLRSLAPDHVRLLAQRKRD